MKKMISRKYLIESLNSWQEEEISTVEIFETANQLYFIRKTEFNHLDNENNSVSHIVIQKLDCLNINLVTKDDIDELRKFLILKIDNFEQNLYSWQKYSSTIDYSN